MTWLAPVLTVAAVVVAVGWTARAAAGRGLDGDAFRAAVLAALGGWLGGALLYGGTHGVWDGRGQSAFGVFAGAALMGAAYLRSRGRPVLPFADVAAPGLALGYAVARLGCFVNGDDFGVTTSARWGVRYGPGTEAWAAHLSRGWIEPDAMASLPVVPVQLLLSAAAVAIFTALVVGRRAAGLRPGAVAGVAAIAYGIARLGLEPLRHDFRAVLGPFSLPQLLAIGLAVAGAALILTARPHRAGAEDRAGLPPARARSRPPRLEAQRP